jgi:hypothetical protein
MKKTSIMASPLERAGVLKKLTGNQRRRLLEQQAAQSGENPDVLLQNRKQKKLAWQALRTALTFTRCCNCGHTGHDFDYCPFALPHFLSQSRFRGPNGQWHPEESAVQLTKKEQLRCIKHFEILSLPVPQANQPLFTASDFGK